MKDPRIDPLNNAAILTDTVMRLAFAPADPKAKVTALRVPMRASKLEAMQSSMRLGTVHLQLKAGFAPERHIELTPPELFALLEMGDRFITELPEAQRAAPVPDAEG